MSRFKVSRNWFGRKKAARADDQIVTDERANRVAGFDLMTIVARSLR